MLRTAAAVIVGCLALAAAPRLARAGAWYYTWQCSGQCAPGQLAIHGFEGPFASQAECDAVRWNDPRRETFVAPGNLGGLDFCRESDGPPSVDGGPGATQPYVLARFVLAAVAGPSYRVQDPTGIETSTGGTGGIELGLHFGGHPVLGLETSIGLHYSEVTAAHYGAESKPMIFIPYVFGLVSSPRIARSRTTEVRLDLAADFGFLFRVGCSDCEADALPTLSVIGELRAGIDTYLGRTRGGGIGVDAVFMLGSEGAVDDPATPSAVAILPPTFLVRVSLLARNNRHVAW